MNIRNEQSKPTTDVLSVKEIKGFIHRNWTIPNWRIDVAENDNKEDYVIVLIADSKFAENKGFENAQNELRRLFARRFSFSLGAHFLEANESNYTYSSLYSIPKRRFTNHGFRLMTQRRETNCGNCRERMKAGSWHCPILDREVDDKHICDCYRPGLM